VTYRLSHLPVHAVPFHGLDYARGHLDTLLPLGNGALQVSGWMSAHGDAIDDIAVYLDGRYLQAVPVLPTPGLKARFPWYPHAETAGFAFELPGTTEHTERTENSYPGDLGGLGSGVDQTGTTRRLDLVARRLGAPRVRLSQLVRRDLDLFPTPPESYIYRVAHMRQAHNFKVAGLKSVGDFLEAFARHADFSRVRRMLDWGCGCGRMSMYFLAAADCPEFAGGDIDRDAIAWNNQHLRAGHFSTLEPMPPTPYPSGHFDLVIAYSVFTHLAREVQQAWLGELHRILAPGGLLLASLHGQIAYDFARGRLASRFPRAGIVDRYRDATLGAIAPRGYYRATYQSREYTMREFGRDFAILEYGELGAINQDLVVLRRR
jgi:SAM-dependent methyltransferase